MVQAAVVLDTHYIFVKRWKRMPFIYVSSCQKILKGEWRYIDKISGYSSINWVHFLVNSWKPIIDRQLYSFHYLEQGVEQASCFGRLWCITLVRFFSATSCLETIRQTRLFWTPQNKNAAGKEKAINDVSKKKKKNGSTRNNKKLEILWSKNLMFCALLWKWNVLVNLGVKFDLGSLTGAC